jgi:hypothetical protein
MPAVPAYGGGVHTNMLKKYHKATVRYGTYAPTYAPQEPYSTTYSFHFKLRIMSIYIISTFKKRLGPGVYSASNRNEYQKHRNNNVSGE